MSNQKELAKQLAALMETRKGGNGGMLPPAGGTFAPLGSLNQPAIYQPPAQMMQPVEPPPTTINAVPIPGQLPANPLQIPTFYSVSNGKPASQVPDTWMPVITWWNAKRFHPNYPYRFLFLLRGLMASPFIQPKGTAISIGILAGSIALIFFTVVGLSVYVTNKPVAEQAPAKAWRQVTTDSSKWLPTVD